MIVQTTLWNLTDAEQITLVQDVLRGDEAAIATFSTCTKRLLTSLAAHSSVLYNDRAYELQDLVAWTLAHLVCGLRLSRHSVPPLHTWLANREHGIPLAAHVANYAHWFLLSLARQQRIETVLQNADTKETDHNTLSYYDNLPDTTCAIAEEIVVYSTFQVWWEQRTPAERALLHLLSPEGEDLTLEKAAEQRGASITTLHRRRKHLRDSLVAFLNAA